MSKHKLSSWPDLGTFQTTHFQKGKKKKTLVFGNIDQSFYINREPEKNADLIINHIV